MKQKELHDELASIRNLMERSSKFISLSGLSGILAGIYALIGAGLAYTIGINVFNIPLITDEPDSGVFFIAASYLTQRLFMIALAVFIASVGTGILLSMRKAKQQHQPLWGKTSRALLFHMIVPLMSGGLLILILIARGYYGIVAPASLIFYGLALISASNFTFTDVKYLGICEIILGLIAACLPGYGLLFWAIGFGLLHIVYGSVMYFKYDR